MNLSGCSNKRNELMLSRPLTRHWSEHWLCRQNNACDWLPAM